MSWERFAVANAAACFANYPELNGPWTDESLMSCCGTSRPRMPLQLSVCLAPSDGPEAPGSGQTLVAFQAYGFTLIYIHLAPIRSGIATQIFTSVQVQL